MAEHDRLYYTVQLEMKELRKQVSQFESEMAKMRGETDKTTAQMGQAFSKLGKLFAGYLTVDTLKNFVTKVVQVRGEMQALEIGFRTMLGSQEKATKLMQELSETALKTPFDFAGIAQGAKQLLAYGTQADEVNETLTRLGNIASGLKIPLNDIVYLYGTTQIQGKVWAKDIQQFMGRGIPIVQELAKNFNVTQDEIYSMVSASKVGFADVKKALENLTNEGGQFYNLMEQESKALTGQISNLEEDFTTMFNEIGESSEGFLSDAVSLVSALVKNYKDVARAIAVLVTTYGTYNAALQVNLAIQKKGALYNAVQNIMSMTKALKGAKNAQELFNAVAIKNPWVLLATAIVSTISAIMLFNSQSRKTEAGLKKADEAMGAINQTTQTFKSNIEGLTSALRDNSKSMQERMLAYLQFEKSTKNIHGFDGKQLKLPSAEEMMSMSAKDMDKLMIEVEFAKRWTETIKAYNEAQKRGVEERDFTEAKRLGAELDNIKKEYAERINMQEKALEQGSQLEVKNKAYYERLLKDETEMWEKMTAEEREAYRKTYEEKVKGYNEAIKGWEITEKKTKEAVNKQKEYNEALSEYKRILSELSTVGMTGFMAEEAQAKARLDETLAKLSELKAKGVDTSEGERKAKGRYDEDISDIQLRKAEEVANVYEKLNEQLRTTEQQRINDIEKEYDELIENIKEKFGDAESSPLVEQLNKAREVSKQIAQTEAQSARETTELEIEKIQLQADRNMGIISEQEYLDAILQTDIKIAETELAKLEAQAKVIENEEILLAIDKQRANLRELQTRKTQEEQTQTGIFSNNEDASKRKIEQMQGVADLLSTVTSSLSDIEGELGKIFQGISEGAQALGNSMSAVASGDKMAMIQSAAQGTADLIGMAVKSVQDGKKAREEWRKQEEEANAKLVKMRLDAMTYEESIFGDVGNEEQLLSLIEKRNMAQIELFKTIEKMEQEGQVKTGTKKIIDPSKVAKATGVGAGAGLAVGSLFGPIGAAIGTAAGAITGAIVGLFSRETVDVYDSLLSQYGELIDEKTMTLNEKLLADYDKLDEATKAMVDNAQELLETYKETKKEYEEQIAEMYGNIKQELSQNLADAFRNGKVYDAIDDFKDYLGERIAEVLQARAFERFFSEAMKGVEEVAKGDITDPEQIAVEIAKVQNVMTAERLNAYKMLMDGYQKAFSDMAGIDISGTKEAGQEAMSGAISSMTEDTASALNANFMGLKVSAQEINSKVASISDNIPIVNDLLSRGVEYQRRTADNTDVMVEELRTIRRDGVIMR